MFCVNRMNNAKCFLLYDRRDDHIHLPIRTYVVVDDDFILVHQVGEHAYNHVPSEEKLQRHKRQTDGSSNNAGSGSLISIPEPIFFPKAIGTFQLALKSDQSIVAIIGNDYNIYLSAQSLSATIPSTFSLINLGIQNNSYVALIQDTKNKRYLHAYNDIQKNNYTHIRTHLDTYMPCNANIIFWTFVRGYLQFYRGGLWFYDTAACSDPSTGLVKLWLVNGQQGLTSLQAKYNDCGLAPLVAINY